MGRKSESGGVKPKGNRIQFDFWFRKVRCRPTIDLKPSTANLLYARSMHKKILEEIRHGTFNIHEHFPRYVPEFLTATGAAPLRVKTFNEYADAYLVSISGIGASTQDTYRRALMHWRSWFGESRIDTILHSDVTTKLGAHGWKTNKTRNNVVSVARGVFKLAWRDQVLKVNPIEGVEGLPLEDQDPDPFDLDELEIVLEKLQKVSGPEVRDYFEFAFFTGLRPSEQIELKWTKFDERSRMIRIDHSRVRGKAKTAEATKFKTSSVSKRGTKTHHDRDVKLNKRAFAVIRRQKARTMLRGEHVFLNPATGAHWNDSNKQGDIWRAAMRLTKLRYRTQYETRSTYASIMLTAGMRPAVCARLLGHSLQVFFTKYAKLLDDKKLEASEMNKLEDFLDAGSAIEDTGSE